MLFMPDYLLSFSKPWKICEDRVSFPLQFSEKGTPTQWDDISFGNPPSVEGTCSWS